LKSVAVLQARTNSSRLPGKVLLPINGMPLAVLAAKRAANTGREVVIATSHEPTDDAFADLVVQHDIRCFRGSLDDTLERVVAALTGFDDDTLVFRLTADNVFPDGALLDEIEQDFIDRDLDYLCCNGEESGLPYGVSAELMRARYLREAAASTQSKHDREHVTPYIRRKFGEAYFEKYKALNKGHFRCSVDCLDDYLTILQVFSGIEDPTRISVFDLVARLETAPYQPLQSVPARKLILGTVQLGLTYGIANQSGKPDHSTAEKLIKTAITNGVPYLDTARAYGESEDVIGNALRSGWEGRAGIITKLSPLADCPPDATSAVVDAFVDASIYRSCASLRMQSLNVLMLHRASHLTDWKGRVWTRLLEHKAKDTVKALGVSVQSPAELELALAVPEVGFVQMPFNVLDWRWDDLISEIMAQREQRGLVVHVRSALLQGLLTSPSAALWQQANVLHPQPIIAWLAEQQHLTNRVTVTDFCLSFVKSLDWVDGLVVGMESLDQLNENIQIVCGPDLSRQEMDVIGATRPRLEEDALNPASWRQIA